MDGGGSSESGDWKPAQVEMRRAPDGVAYTRQEFIDFFGGLDEWHAAHVLVETRAPAAWTAAHAGGSIATNAARAAAAYVGSQLVADGEAAAGPPPQPPPQQWAAPPPLPPTTSLVGSADVLRPSKHGQAYQCPECSALFNCATHKWGTFLDHIKCQHPGAVKPNRKDEGVIVDVDADGHVLKNTFAVRGKWSARANGSWKTSE